MSILPFDAQLAQIKQSSGVINQAQMLWRLKGG
jgi:hypothetical protein